MKALQEERGDLILRDFQQSALDKFAAVRDEYPNVLILDEMGTGKTVQAVCLDLKHRDVRGGSGFKTLVVTMNGAMTSTWQAHFEWIAPWLKTVILDPKARGRSWHEFRSSDADVLILHWEAVHIMMPDFLTEFMWGHVIADECHKIKNRKTKMAVSLKKIKAAHKTGLSGTPSTGNPADLWSILNWLYPKHTWGTGSKGYWKFFEHYVKSEVTYPQGYRKVIGPQNETELQKYMEPFTVRRLKKHVMPELPDKIFETVPIIMTPQQEKAYRQMKEDMVAWVASAKGDSDDMDPIVANAVIAKLVRLQQFASAYAVLNDDGTVSLSEPSSKLDEVMIRLQSRIDEGGQVVVFSAFKQLIYLLKIRLDKAKISYVELTGDIATPQRNKNVEDFQAGKASVFLGTIKAGGTGIELTASSMVMFLAREWSPNENNQAIDRLHRIGQKDSVHVIDFVTEDTVEPDKNTQVELKWSWVEQLLGDNNSKPTFS